jgi:hypothetical protein
VLRTILPALKHTQTGTCFEAWLLTELNRDSKLIRLRTLRERLVTSQHLLPQHTGLQQANSCSDLNNGPSGLDHFLQLQRRLRKLWHEIDVRDSSCKTALNWVTKAIRKMARRNATERWERKLSNAEITPHAIWPLVKSLMRRVKTKGTISHPQS